MKSFVQAAFVIGRRDFTATVWSRTFLFFLLGPLVMDRRPGPLVAARPGDIPA